MQVINIQITLVYHFDSRIPGRKHPPLAIFHSCTYWNNSISQGQRCSALADTRCQDQIWVHVYELENDLSFNPFLHYLVFVQTTLSGVNNSFAPHKSSGLSIPCPGVQFIHVGIPSSLQTTSIVQHSHVRGSK
ncbi:hypothetical protein FGO68_gene8185 [Halteria grandinella]|uniref:Uncharacterized protein n=1 Tax=Halteria grandinella TaxID=5974 RepID=A0A8J8T9Y0_HALGN|nr:hypothetical protein FGO68_gene8185 [Halteria grandinella]